MQLSGGGRNKERTKENRNGWMVAVGSHHEARQKRWILLLFLSSFLGAGTTQHNLSCTTTTRQTEKKNCHSPLGRIFPEKRLNKNIKEKKFIF
jgi:hypothetical protein